jgi:CRP-like cAMP-binding protein
MATSTRAAPQNRLLDSLPVADRKALLASCDLVELVFAEVLCESGEQIRHVYFPTTGFISVVTALDSRARLEVGIVGDEGMLGASLVLGVGVSPQHALVQGAGSALRMNTATFVRHCKRSEALRQCLNRYVYVLASQLAQIAACTHFHNIEARLARWLLLTRDRAYSTRFRLTQDFASYMLGVRRVGITEAAGKLQKRGLIKYRRGEVVILDAVRLEKASCSCYQQGNAMYEQTMGKPGRARRS